MENTNMHTLYRCRIQSAKASRRESGWKNDKKPVTTWWLEMWCDVHTATINDHISIPLLNWRCPIALYMASWIFCIAISSRCNRFDKSMHRIQTHKHSQPCVGDLHLTLSFTCQTTINSNGKKGDLNFRKFLFHSFYLVKEREWDEKRKKE